jgi:hypothetical protein
MRRLPALTQFKIERQAAEYIKAAAHTGDEEVVAGRELIEDGEVEAHGVWDNE